MDHSNLDSIYQEYMPDVYRYLLSLSQDRYLAEDLLQETFFRAYLHIEELNHKKIKPWLFRVAHNAFVDHQRKHRRHLIKDESFFQTFVQRDSLEEQVIWREQFSEIKRMLTELPDKQRHAILLVDFYDLSYKDAAAIMDISLSHIKVLLFRARQTVRLHKERNEQRE